MKTKQLSIRLNETDYQKIKELAAHNNKTVTAHLITSALSPGNTVRYSKEMAHFLQYINGFSFCVEGILPKQQLDELHKEIEKLWQFLNS